ncbi:peptidase S24/S26A/S26B/S26C [Jimgerdemannia flammicorona]|uniref:Peptidase S24/S26A/S26B/S26C n=1 Tax=Jimgerdemannia flammicorona TaxID=994334 RepID=A0A433DNT1_9FUNG|nr:peptidase S24/S26A/S26B/S26C [Jimgerdemannia flammicorona]
MNVLRKVGYIIQFGCFVHLFNKYVGEITFCLGPSMLPTFNMVGDLVVLEHLSPQLKRVDVGDVVVCVSPTNPGRAVCKRILGMPGDYICADPTVLERRYLTVPKGHVWLGGDNISNSTDSRVYGPVPYALVKGRVFARLWPQPGWIRNGLVPLQKDDS